MVFPAIIVMAIEKIEHLPEKIGTIYALDVFGAVSGALISGFLVIPFWGIKMLIFSSVVLNLIIGVMVIFQKNKKFKWIILFFMAIIFMAYGIIHPLEGELNIYTHHGKDTRYLARDNLLYATGRPSPYFQKVKIKKKIFSNIRLMAP